jgi:hypothetical protein
LDRAALRLICLYQGSESFAPATTSMEEIKEVDENSDSDLSLTLP